MSNSNDSLGLSGYVARGSDGNVDIQATHVKFTQDLNKFIQMEKADGEIIGKAVEKVWLDNPDSKTLVMGALVHYAMQNLEYSPEMYGDLSERVAEHIRNKPGLYKINKGKGGGVSRVTSDVHTSSVPAGGSIRPKSTGTNG